MMRRQLPINANFRKRTPQEAYRADGPFSILFIKDRFAVVTLQ